MQNAKLWSEAEFLRPQSLRTECEALVRSSSFKTFRFKCSQRGLQSEELWVEGNPQVIWQEWCYKHNYNLAERELDIGCTASFLPEDQVRIAPLALVIIFQQVLCSLSSLMLGLETRPAPSVSYFS
ncbi:hypothetical protein B0H13DRAFT_1908526 [Mycena leptocephala]|nr:hypothetical protein B0H13DRAFT_1908526 [Mycena leptocephala]